MIPCKAEIKFTFRSGSSTRFGRIVLGSFILEWKWKGHQSRWVHRKSNLMFTLRSDKDQRKNSHSLLLKHKRTLIVKNSNDPHDISWQGICPSQLCHITLLHDLDTNNSLHHAHNCRQFKNSFHHKHLIWQVGLRQVKLNKSCHHKHLSPDNFVKGISLFYLPQATCLLWHQYSYSYPSVHGQEAWCWLDSNRNGNYPTRTEASSHSQADSHRPPGMYDQQDHYDSSVNAIKISEMENSIRPYEIKCMWKKRKIEFNSVWNINLN